MLNGNVMLNFGLKLMEVINICHIGQLRVDQEQNGRCTSPIDCAFPFEHLLTLSISNVVWYADLVNYLDYGITPRTCGDDIVR